MARISPRAQRSRRTALLISAVLVTLLIILTSYAIAADPMPPADIGDPTASATDERPLDWAIADHDQAAPSDDVPMATGSGPIGIEDGVIADGETVSPFDTEHPAITNLDPDLRTALRSAAADANADGVETVITSGWRSRRYQQALLDEAVVTYGSEEEARRWVNTPDESTHVTGDAVDVGYTDADYWLIQYGNDYGLCQIYANEIWHFELAVEPGEACPVPLTDATSARSGGSTGLTSERDNPGTTSSTMTFDPVTKRDGNRPATRSRPHVEIVRAAPRPVRTERLSSTADAGLCLGPPDDQKV